jgi:FkbM family methyltransferase
VGIAQRIARSFLVRSGYHVKKLAHLSYGVDLWHDLERLSDRLDIAITTVFDVGANSGDATVVALARFPDCRVFAFEPHPAIYSKLAARVNGDRCTPIQVALSDAPGKHRFFDYGGPGHINSLVENAPYTERFKMPATLMEVEVDTIDNVCTSHNVERINFLKVDTEGNDYRTLLGARKMLEGGRVDLVYFEFNDFRCKPGATGGSLNEISDYLCDFSFRFIATYTDYVVTEGEPFVVANALMARGRQGRRQAG